MQIIIFNKKIIILFAGTILFNSYIYGLIKFTYPTEALKIAYSYLPNNPIILEAGAYDGTDTLYMHRQWPNGIIHAFEPVPQIYERLLAKVEDHNNIYTYNIALGNTNGKSTFYISYDAGIPQTTTQASSLLPPKDHYKHAPYTHFKQSTIQTITLDTWAKKHGISRVDFMWLDMQGYELNMLKASSTILKTVKAILTEVEFVEAYEGQYLFKDVKNWLESQGFEMIATSFDEGWYGDALFVRK